MSYKDNEVSGEMLDKPLPKGGDFGPMELLPEREWLRASITDVKMVYAMFKGQIQYLTKKNEATGEDEPILDSKTGEKIPRFQVVIVYSLWDYKLGNGSPRMGWAYFGASIGEKAHLPKYLLKLGGSSLFKGPLDEVRQPSFNEIKKFILDNGKYIFVQFATKESSDPDEEVRQNIVKDAIKLSPKPFPENESFFSKPEEKVANKNVEKSPFGDFASEGVQADVKPKSEPAWDD